ncbi:hypothetical protein DENSPDRAFT_794741 [Dentipellis sp. KUC8613]|nr:hypothetical protein DENSPDRAFT_794741 [Dentipellis sp. KUC8613]
MPRKAGPPAALRIDTPAQHVACMVETAPSPSDSESSFLPPPSKSRSSRNMKRLSLTLPSAQSSTSSLAIPDPTQPEVPAGERRRRPSVVSLPVISAPTLLRKEEEGSPSVPYLDGPIEILPKIWLGSEDNARNWPVLMERSIRSILNVAKEVNSPFDSLSAQSSLRPFSSTPNLSDTLKEQQDTYYPPHKLSGRPGMHYLKLQWSHGQTDLVQHGFAAAMAFVDQSLERGDGVLIHCQCGISRSATMVIALVMRAAALRSASAPPEVWELKGMQAAYAYVKEKSKWVGPNMSLIYQLLDYERTLRGDDVSPGYSDRSSTHASEEEEWSRRRQMLDDASEPEEEPENSEIMREARALDKAMEERIIARKSSSSSVGSGLGMGTAWRNRYAARKRTGSIASNFTSNSILSEDLVEEDEEEELLGTGKGFDATSTETTASSNIENVEEASSESDFDISQATPLASRTMRPSRVPPSAPATKASFTLPPVPATAVRSTFDLPPRHSIPLKGKRRPPPLGALAPVPHSPVTLIQVESGPVPSPRPRTEARKPVPPPLHLRKNRESSMSSSSLSSLSSTSSSRSSSRNVSVSTPSQTLFVFPPSPTRNARTPSAMTLTSNQPPVPFPAALTPRMSAFKGQGRNRSFLGIVAPPTPTTAHSRVDARGWIGSN